MKRSFCHLFHLFVLSFLVMIGFASPSQAHPMGNFAICHYAKIMVSAPGKPVRLRYVLDFAEIPALSEKTAMDTNGDGSISITEKRLYLESAAKRLTEGLTLTVNGASEPLAVKGSDLDWSPGAGGLQTLKIKLDLESANSLPRTGQVTAEYRDTNYPNRTGWKEIVATTDDGTLTLQDANVNSVDISEELSRYPARDIPPQQTEANFTVVPGMGGDPSTPTITAANTRNTTTANPSTPRDPFTEAIHQELTPWMILLGLLIAFVYGGLHGLGPGHGKTMVAAYLVGTRGTPRHAVLLGLIVTITHTLGVFALGAVTILLEKYIVPEKLYPVLSAFSGLSVAAVGGWLLYTRLRIANADIHHHHGHSHSHDHDHDHSHSHDHDHDHSHSHDHDHAHPHSHDLDEIGGHDHGFGYHTHSVPVGAITPRTLIALGISGGIVPCPSALVVLLAAIALDRVAYGMVLIIAFSLGLASVLIAIGLTVVLARHWLERLPQKGLSSGRIRAIGRLLPIASAAAITGIGVVLTVRAFLPGAQ